VHLLDAEIRDEAAVFLLDLAKTLLRVIDQVHLVHGKHDVTNPDEGHQEGVSFRLGENALACIDQHDRHIRRRGAGDHVARVLLVARRVGNDVLALRRREVAVGDVDGDALLALRVEAVEQQGEIQPGTLGAGFARIRLQRGDLILEQGAGCVEQTADERALSVIDTAAGEKPQQALAAARELRGFDREVFLDRTHQK
jgi:hypothetical protein